MSVEGLFVHGGDLWRLNTPLSCLQPPQQGKTHIKTHYYHWNVTGPMFNSLHLMFENQYNELATAVDDI
ncbi:ferritin-like domain-containing protein, partial [Escherichia coli]|uniref:ferritin-like domain-containing protein n=3 Tax=Enterobacterales TaxID=91347 RepID=UPI003211F454